MKYTTTQVAGTIEFLAANDFTAIPQAITGSGVVKAGTPILDTGAAGAIANAIGILLYDVDVDANPNGALLVRGVVDLTKMNAHSGLSLTAADIKSALPGIVCRENIGVNQ